MTVSVTYVSYVTMVETLGGPFISADDSTVTTNGLNKLATLDATTTPPVTKGTGFRQALTAGAATIDLTSLPDSAGNAGAVTFLGLKVQVAKFRNPSTNANAITIKQGGTNGHPLFTTEGITLQPGEEWTYEGNDIGTDVAAGDKTWDLTGTGSQALDVHLVAG